MLQRIDHGFYPFSEFMHDALYTPGLGYYSGGRTKLGNKGDFVTAPEISPFFGKLLARLAIPLIKEGKGIMELGAGTGLLALQMLRELEAHELTPTYYNILEVSADLRERQHKLLSSELPHLIGRIHWLESLPDQLEGLIFGNEVIDALPCSLIRWEAHNIYEIGVGQKKNSLIFTDRLLTDGPLFTEATRLKSLYGLGREENYTSEIGLACLSLIKSLSKRLVSGALVFIDYGFGESEYYHSERQQGTLMCHYQQQVHSDPLFLPGQQDITSHVNFSRIYEIATQSGLNLSGYTTQAHFLVNLDILDFLKGIEPINPEAINALHGAQILLSPAEMGEIFKVIAFTTEDEDTALVGFNSWDLSRLL